MNPGQSVKDRAALFIIHDAVKRGELRPGGVIVEGTAGNTGIGLALVGNAMGFRTVIVIPETQSQEKKDTLRLCGAELIEVPAVLFKSEQLRESLRPARRAIGEDRKERRDLGQPVRQCRQPPGPYRDHRPGNLAADRRQGRRLRLRRRHRRHARRRRHGAEGAQQAHVRIALADPMGAALYSYYTTGALKSEGSSITEGIGQGRITTNLEGAPIDAAYQIPDAEARADHFRSARTRRPVPRRLLRHQCRRRRPARQGARPGHTIVTMLADYGTRYQSKLFNPEFLREKNLPVPPGSSASRTSKFPLSELRE